MTRLIAVVIAIAIAAMLGAGAYIYSGVFDVAASDPHWAVTAWVLETARSRSIEVHAARIKPPADLADHAKVAAGASHFSDHCAVCHSAPGVEASDMAEGMYPKPPHLADAAVRRSPAELFWILKNGIKMSGMPAWGDHGDDDLWNIVAFLEQLPKLSPQGYDQLVTESMAAGGHMMHGSGHMMDRHGSAPYDGSRSGGPAPDATTPQRGG